MQIVVLPGDVEIVRMTALAGQDGRAGIRRQVEFPLGGRGRDHGHGQVRPDDAGEHVDLFRLDHLVGELDGNVRLALIVFDDDLEVFIAGLLDRKHEAVPHIDAEARAAAGQCGDHADLDRFGLGCRETDRKCGGGCHCGEFHLLFLLVFRLLFPVIFSCRHASFCEPGRPRACFIVIILAPNRIVRSSVRSEPEPLDLAGFRFRQGVFEDDRSWVFVRRDRRFDVIFQSLDELF